MLTNLIRSVFGRLGYEPKRDYKQDLLAWLSPDERELFSLAADRTMVRPHNVALAVRAARHVAKFGIPGDIVECGVWRGGVMMAMLRSLVYFGDTSRHAWLYDTYEGLPPPGNEDRGLDGRDPHAIFQTHERTETGSSWCRASLDDVKEGIARCSYPIAKIHFVKGKVEDTIPGTMPKAIAVLRLDTDWYESTRHEMQHLYPLLSPGGVLIVDDYGTWAGSRKAVDEYFGAALPFVFEGEAGVGYLVKH